MKCRLHLALILLLGCASGLSSSEVLDRVVAVVGGRPILASEWDDVVRYECLLNQCGLAGITTAERQATLRRMIDQRLIEQEMKMEDPHPVSAEEVSRKMGELKAQILRNRISTSGMESLEWKAVLSQYGFTPEEVEDQVTHELSVLRFVDRRFRPAIQIEPAEIERYYRETLMPQLEKAGAPDPPLAAVAAQIRELLTQKVLNEQLSAWLQTLRQQGRIQMR
jgi:SurA-like N-terminal domain